MYARCCAPLLPTGVPAFKHHRRQARTLTLRVLNHSAGRAARLTRFLQDCQPWAADVPGELAWISVSSGRPASNGGGGNGGGAVLGSYEMREAGNEVGTSVPLMCHHS